MKILFRCSIIVLVVPIITTLSRLYGAEDDLGGIKSEITKLHDESVKRLQDWIAQVSIAAEDR